MEFKKTNEDMNFIDQQFADEPHMNVVGKEDFEKRVNKVFTMLWEKLSKSFGPGGAGTFISIYPNYYNTKDGFTIMKNIAFDKKLDQVICDIVMTICSRLNFTVGDGTTTATIATKSMYDAYLSIKDAFTKDNILPREILSRYENIKNTILKKIDEVAIPMKDDDPESLKKSIRDVVYISSNGNDDMTEMISSLYSELMYPAITCKLSSTGVTNSTIIEGYKIDVALTDKIYINNDDNTMLLRGSDVIIFDHKVTQDTYEYILKPLANQSYQRHRHLICIAPFYDETALGGIIRRDLNRQFSTNKDISLVLTVCSKPSGHAKVLLDDLAMLLNTLTITPAMEREIIDAYKSYQGNILNVFDIDNRGIEGIEVLCQPDPNSDMYFGVYREGMKIAYPDNGNLHKLGYCDSCNIGLKESTFSGFYYDEQLFNTYVSTAFNELKEVQRKCENIGTFSTELTEKQQRFYSLRLKTGVIEVGSTSEISQGYLKDAFDDSIKAAKSAFYNGTVLGCNVTTQRIISDLIKDAGDNSIERLLLGLLKEGFKSVYSTVLQNIIPDDKLYDVTVTSKDDRNKIIDTIYDNFMSRIRKISQYANASIPKEYIEQVINNGLISVTDVHMHNLIAEISIYTNKVFDLSIGEFNNDVINSAETDKEIIKAVIDLLGLLITGNQLVLR